MGDVTQETAEAPSSESKKQRVDRELNELLGELRIAVPGVQVLFAFLLAVPFTPRFPSLDGVERAVFFVAFAAAAISSIMLTAPSSNHRLAFRAHDKEKLLFRANRFAIVGIAFLALAIASVVYLITAMVVGARFAPAATLAATLLIGATWYLLPLIRRAQQRGEG